MDPRHAEARHHGHHFTVDVLPGPGGAHQHIVLVLDDDAPARRRTDEYITDDSNPLQALDHGVRIAHSLIEESEDGEGRDTGDGARPACGGSPLPM